MSTALQSLGPLSDSFFQEQVLGNSAAKGVAVSSPECGQSILATFHRKPDLRDRTGRKQADCHQCQFRILTGPSNRTILSSGSQIHQSTQTVTQATSQWRTLRKPLLRLLHA